MSPHGVRAIVDTSVLIATDVPALEGDLAISAASLAELSFGVLVATDLCGRRGRDGRQPRSRVTDLLIAATAHAHSARLDTRDADDLRGLEDLVEIVTV